MRIVIRGAVQGVGFRPFIYRVATEMGLNGWVNNSCQGVFIEVEGPPARLQEFLLRIEPEAPPRAFISSLESSLLDPVGFEGFTIRQSDDSGAKTALVLPDIATCPECVQEIFDPANRRYLYPFTNCTNCGPRFSILESLPYDRPNTTMRRFAMCPECRAEYENPLDRRFHAQPNACPVCGPQLALWNRAGEILGERQDALLGAAKALRAGAIVALKGIGGFQLLVDARNEEAVRTLRRRKARDAKPLALMFPSLARLEPECRVSALEARLLASPEAPITLLHRRAAGADSEIAPSVAPGNPYLGVMLPYTPLHHLLMAELGFPVVATSGNLSDEPICTDEREALDRLAEIADLFLVHDRPIARHVDDSVARVMLDRELVLRRARGYAPLPVFVKGALRPTLAVGAHLKNAVALATEDRVFVSQHIGDLETEPANAAFERVAADLQTLHEIEPEIVAHDLHPDYRSTRYARQQKAEAKPIQHHFAHVVACMAENELEGPVLGVSWDGTGYGPDGTVWGGEFLRATLTNFERIAHLRPFRLPGGERAVKEPCRSALGLLYALFGEAIFDPEFVIGPHRSPVFNGLAPLEAFLPSERNILRTMLQRGLNAPVTTSAGRLFDAVAAIAGLRQRTRFEGQTAMELGFALEGLEGPPCREAYPIETEIRPGLPAVLDWEPLVHALLRDVAEGVPVSVLSARFHNALAEGILQIALHAELESVVLTGGCFQNRYLCERAVERLREAGFRPYWHQRIPPNDGGIALGQAVAAGKPHSHTGPPAGP